MDDPDRRDQHHLGGGRNIFAIGAQLGSMVVAGVAGLACANQRVQFGVGNAGALVAVGGGGIFSGVVASC